MEIRNGKVGTFGFPERIFQPLRRKYDRCDRLLVVRLAERDECRVITKRIVYFQRKMSSIIQLASRDRPPIASLTESNGDSVAQLAITSPTRFWQYKIFPGLSPPRYKLNIQDYTPVGHRVFRPFSSRPKTPWSHFDTQYSSTIARFFSSRGRFLRRFEYEIQKRLQSFISTVFVEQKCFFYCFEMTLANVGTQISVFAIRSEFTTALKHWK